MDRDHAVADLRREGGAFVAMADSAELSRPVPTCPDWTVADLVKHLGNVYNWAGTIVLGRLSEPPGRDQMPRRGEDEPELAWLARSFDRVVGALESVPLDATAWNFAAGGAAPVGFWWRRQLHETTIHRVDLELACARPVTPIDPALAADGVQEIFDMAGFALVGPDELSEAKDTWIHLHATDVDGAEWTLDTGSRHLARAHMKGDVALRGPAWALMRWLWGRPVGSELEVFGDIDAAEAWRSSLIR